MITYWFFYFVTGVLDGLVVPIQNLPNASLPGGLSAWLSATGGYIALAGRIAPLTIAALNTEPDIGEDLLLAIAF